MYTVPTVTAQVMGEEKISNASIQGRKANETERMVGGNNFSLAEVVSNVVAICSWIEDGWHTTLPNLLVFVSKIVVSVFKKDKNVQI